MQAVEFALDERRFALPLGSVRRIVRAVEVTALPGAPPIVLGAIDVAGTVIAVLDTRQRLGMPARPVDATQHFIIADTARRTVALVIDEPRGVIEPDATRLAEPAQIASGLESLMGIAALEDGLVLIQDLEAFLSNDDARALDESIGRSAHC